MELGNTQGDARGVHTERMLHIHTDIGCKSSSCNTVENTDMKKEPEFHTCSGGTNPCENTKYHVVRDVAKLSDGKTEVGLIDNEYYQDTDRQYTRGMCSNRNYIDTAMIRDIHVDPVKSEPSDEPLETNDQNKFIIEVDTCKDEYYETHGYPNSHASVRLEESVEPGSDRYCVPKERTEHSHIQRGRCTLHTPPNAKPCTVLLSDIRYKYPYIVIEGTVRVSMKMHTPSIQRIHTLQPQKQKEYPCSACGVAFTCKCSLKVNTMVHTGEKPHKCSVCNASFAGKWNLSRHMRTHTGEKPHKCIDCSACFNDINNLHRHERTHTGDKPRICSVYGAEFAHIHHLTRHTGIHTGEKPGKCSVCEITLTRKGSLTAHMRTHTGEKPYNVQFVEGISRINPT